MPADNTQERAEALHRITDIVRCKWSLAVMLELCKGPRRPSDIVRAVSGLSPKVLNERLQKLQRYGLLERRSFNEVPPRVEYELNEHGHRLARLLGDLIGFADQMSFPDTPTE